MQINSSGLTSVIIIINMFCCLLLIVGLPPKVHFIAVVELEWDYAPDGDLLNAAGRYVHKTIIFSNIMSY